MRFRTALAAGAFAASSCSIAASSPDGITLGRALVTENCISCHQSEVYTRHDRRVISRDGLHAQVGRCEQSLGLRWFEEDIENVAAYLNHEFYHLP